MITDMDTNEEFEDHLLIQCSTCTW
jgi:hypothetical protein